MHGDALETFKNITSPNREILGEILTVFRLKYVKHQSMATAKHKFQRLGFNPANQKIIDFTHELQKVAKDAFGVATQPIIEQFNSAKMPAHRKKSNIQALLENGTYEQIVAHLERELELNGLEAPDETQINTVTRQASQQNLQKSKPTCHQCKKPAHYRNQCRQLKRKKDQIQKKTGKVPEITTTTIAVPEQTPTPTLKFQAITRRTIQIIMETEDPGLSSQPVRPVVELTTPQRNVTLEQTQQIDRLPGLDDRKDKNKSSREMLKATQRGMSKLQPKL